MSFRSTGGDLVPQDVAQVVAQVKQANRSRKPRIGSIIRAFSWIKGKRKRRKKKKSSVQHRSGGLAEGHQQGHDLSKLSPGKEDAVCSTAAQHFPENVFVEGVRPQHLEELHSEAQEGLKIQQLEEKENELDFQDDQSVSSSVALQPEDDRFSQRRDSLQSRSITAETASTISRRSIRSTRSIRSQGSTFRPLNLGKVSPGEDPQRKARGTTVIPPHIQQELGLDRAALSQHDVDGRLTNGGDMATSCSQQWAHVHLPGEGYQLQSHNLQTAHGEEGQPTHEVDPHLLAMLRPQSLAAPGITTDGLLQTPPSPVMYISPQATYLSKIIPNAVLPVDVDVVEISRTRSRSSLRTLSKSSLVSASPAPSRASEHYNRYDRYELSSRGSTWSKSGSSDTLVSDSSSVSSQGSGSTPRAPSRGSSMPERHYKPAMDQVSIISSISCVSSTSGNQVVNGKRPELREITSKMLQDRSSLRSLSVTKTKRAPPPPRRTNSLHQEKFKSHNQYAVDLEGLLAKTVSPYSGYTTQDGTNPGCPGNQKSQPAKLPPVKLSSAISEPIQDTTTGCPYVISFTGNTAASPSAVVALKDLFDIPQPPQVQAPLCPPPETWLHNGRIVSLLCTLSAGRPSAQEECQQQSNAPSPQNGGLIHNGMTAFSSGENNTSSSNKGDLTLILRDSKSVCDGSTDTQEIEQEKPVLQKGSLPQISRESSLKVPEKEPEAVQARPRTPRKGIFSLGAQKKEKADRLSHKKEPAMKKGSPSSLRGQSHKVTEGSRHGMGMNILPGPKESSVSLTNVDTLDSLQDGKSMQILSVDVPRSVTVSPPPSPPPAHLPPPPPAARHTPVSSVVHLPPVTVQQLSGSDIFTNSLTARIGAVSIPPLLEDIPPPPQEAPPPPPVMIPPMHPLTVFPENIPPPPKQAPPPPPVSMHPTPPLNITQERIPPPPGTIPPTPPLNITQERIPPPPGTIPPAPPLNITQERIPLPPVTIPPAPPLNITQERIPPPPVTIPPAPPLNITQEHIPPPPVTIPPAPPLNITQERIPPPPVTIPPAPPLNITQERIPPPPVTIPAAPPLNITQERILPPPVTIPPAPPLNITQERILPPPVTIPPAPPLNITQERIPLPPVTIPPAPPLNITQERIPPPPVTIPAAPPLNITQERILPPPVTIPPAPPLNITQERIPLPPVTIPPAPPLNITQERILPPPVTIPPAPPLNITQERIPPPPVTIPLAAPLNVPQEGLLPPPVTIPPAPPLTITQEGIPPPPPVTIPPARPLKIPRESTAHPPQVTIPLAAPYNVTQEDIPPPPPITIPQASSQNVPQDSIPPPPPVSIQPAQPPNVSHEGIPPPPAVSVQPAQPPNVSHEGIPPPTPVTIPQALPLTIPQGDISPPAPVIILPAPPLSAPQQSIPPSPPDSVLLAVPINISHKDISPPSGQSAPLSDMHLATPLLEEVKTSSRDQTVPPEHDCECKDSLTNSRSIPLPKEDCSIPISPSLLQKIQLNHIQFSDSPEGGGSGVNGTVQEQSSADGQCVPKKPIYKFLSGTSPLATILSPPVATPVTVSTLRNITSTTATKRSMTPADIPILPDVTSAPPSIAIPPMTSGLPILTPATTTKVTVSLNVTPAAIVSATNPAPSNGTPVQSNIMPATSALILRPTSTPPTRTSAKSSIKKSNLPRLVPAQCPVMTLVSANKSTAATANTPSMRLQEAIRMKTAAMSTRDGPMARLNLPIPTSPSSPRSPEGSDLHKSPASTASFIFSKSTKKTIIQAPSSSEGGHLGTSKMPPPVAKKPAAHLPCSSDKLGINMKPGLATSAEVSRAEDHEKTHKLQG